MPVANCLARGRCYEHPVMLHPGSDRGVSTFRGRSLSRSSSHAPARASTSVPEPDRGRGVGRLSLDRDSDWCRLRRCGTLSPLLIHLSRLARSGGIGLGPKQNPQCRGQRRKVRQHRQQECRGRENAKLSDGWEAGDREREETTCVDQGGEEDGAATTSASDAPWSSRTCRRFSMVPSVWARTSRISAPVGSFAAPLMELSGCRELMPATKSRGPARRTRA